MRMYCLTINDSHYEKIKRIGYIPVGLGKNIINKKFQNDKNGENISVKNPYYGEYTFHYWLWKNEIKDLNNEWIGFCQYRKYWSLKNENKNYKSLENFKEKIIKDIPEDFNNYESILGEPLFINQFKLAKFVKKNLSKFIKKPSLIFNEKKKKYKISF